MSSFYWCSPKLQGLCQHQFLIVLASMKHQIFSVPSTHLLFPNKHDYFFYFSPKIFSDFGKILAMYCFMTFSQFISSFKNRTSSNNGYIFFFSCVYTVLRIYFSSLLFLLWHLEYGEWSVLLNSLQLNNQIHIYGTNTAPSTELSPS